MKIYLLLLSTLFTLSSIAQEGWIEEKALDHFIKHPNTWKLKEADSKDEFLMTGPTPKFNANSEHAGTTLYLEKSTSTFTTIELAGEAYKKKLSNMSFLSNTKITKEKKITFNGIEAIEIRFTANIQKIKTACRMIIFQYNNTYYELSVTYDQKLSKKLIKEAFLVMDSFRFAS